MSEPTQTDLKHMNRAIELAEKCRPIADRIPKVGAVIAVSDVIIGEGYRGTGEREDDDHAELRALHSVVNRSQLPDATLYTTLEPCTPEVRSDPNNCCTEWIRRNELKRVLIGTLDPNQGVRGKGLWELQTRGIDVELFPPPLAQRIRVLNERFILAQQTLGIRITSPEPNQIVRTYDKGGALELKGDFLNAPGEDVFVLTNRAGQWWPQGGSLRVTGERQWAATIHFGYYGEHTIYIVKANEVATALVKYYRKVTRANLDRLFQLKGKLNVPADLEDAFLRKLPGSYQGIEMNKLPKGFEIQAKLDLEVEWPPDLKPKS